MRFNARNTAIANAIRQHVIKHTQTLDDGQAIAISVLWSFLLEQAENQGRDVAVLAREQLDAFIKDIAPRFTKEQILKPPPLNG